MGELNILSLFNGMDCGGIALGRAGIKYENYFASETDKFAVKVSSTKFPKHIQIGDVTKVNGDDFPPINLLIGGSPCQGFSFAGKGLNFGDPRSKLFFEYVRILQEIKRKNPDVLFMLENVMMEQWCQNIISKALGVNPIRINSSLVSAQSRDRLYWTNIGLAPGGLFGYPQSTISQPKDKGIILLDILQEEVDEKYYLSDKAMARIMRKGYSKPKVNPEKTGTINAKNNSAQLSFDSGTTLIAVVNDKKGLRFIGDKSLNIDASYGKGYDNHGARTMIVCHNSMPRNGNPKRGGTGPLSRADGKSYALDTQQSNRVQRLFNIDKGGQENILYSPDHKSVALSAVGGGRGAKTGLYQIEERIRRLTPIEVCRLQNVPDDYFFHDGKQIVSDSQIYKMIGNGWTIDVIVHILNYAKGKLK